MLLIKEACNTASHQLANYLTKLLSPLSTFKYTIKNTSAFIAHTKRQNIPKNFKLISFDVTSLFTNVPSDFTIDVILKRIIIPRDYEIETKVYRKSSNNDILCSLAVVLPNNMEMRNAVDIDFKSLQNVVQRPTLEK